MYSVAVIIVNYNAGIMLRDCLYAIASQTVHPDRVLVMDNGSTDGSIEINETVFPWVEFHRLEANFGFAKANNIAVDLVPECEWLALLNPDAYPDPFWLESFLQGARQYLDTDMFASCMLSATQRGIVDGAGDCFRVDGIAWPRFKGLTVDRLPRISDHVFSPSAGAALYRRKVFLEAGGFNERYFCYYEDVDLGFRLRLLGYQCRFLPNAIVHHVGSAVTGKGSDFSIYYVHRNVVWNYFRNMPNPYVWLYLPAHFMVNIASVCLFLSKGRGRMILRAKYDALRALPEILRERTIIQCRRRVPALFVLQIMQRGTLVGSVYRRILKALRKKVSD